ncbi:hypothetical protein HDU99_007494, partial [Rhizoclosmatium hyalinum]
MSDSLDTSFRTAALAVTNLLRAAQASSRSAYDEGYAQCFDDLVAHLTCAAVESGSVSDALASFVAAKQEALSP